jgi:hypothetical protein
MCPPPRQRAHWRPSSRPGRTALAQRRTIAFAPIRARTTMSPRTVRFSSHPGAAVGTSPSRRRPLLLHDPRGLKRKRRAGSRCGDEAEVVAHPGQQTAAERIHAEGVVSSCLDQSPLRNATWLVSRQTWVLVGSGSTSTSFNGVVRGVAIREELALETARNDARDRYEASN